jgi:hypothetical protein
MPKQKKVQPVQWHDVENNSKPANQYRALKPVLGYQAGEVFTAEYKDVRLQLKHKSVEVA